MLPWGQSTPKSANNRSESELVEAARRGDRVAFDGLVNNYQSLLRGFLNRRIGSHAVDDLLQDVWVACWQAIPRFEKRACFKTFLFRIALHKCMDLYRVQGRTPEQVEPSEHLQDPGLRSPEEMYAAAELRETIRQILTLLPQNQQEVIELYYYAEMTLPEISSVLKRNLNTVKYQFYRAHEQVAHRLRDLDMRPVTTPIGEDTLRKRESVK